MHYTEITTFNCWICNPQTVLKLTFSHRAVWEHTFQHFNLLWHLDKKKSDVKVYFISQFRIIQYLLWIVNYSLANMTKHIASKKIRVGRKNKTGFYDNIRRVCWWTRQWVIKTFGVFFLMPQLLCSLAQILIQILIQFMKALKSTWISEPDGKKVVENQGFGFLGAKVKYCILEFLHRHSHTNES